jgi:hypothetical protein
MAAGLLVMSSLLLAELDHVATRELGSEAAVGAVDELRRRMSRPVQPSNQAPKTEVYQRRYAERAGFTPEVRGTTIDCFSARSLVAQASASR